MTHTGDRLSIRYSERERVFVGLWFVSLGLMGWLVLPLLQLNPGDSRYALLLVPALSVVIGGLVAGLAKRHETMIRRDAEITVTSKRYVRGTPTVQTYKTSAVSAIAYMQFAMSGDTESATDRGSTIHLILKNGRTLKVASQRLRKSAGSGQPNGPILDAAKQLAVFLGVPLQHDPQHWRAAE